MAAPAEEPAAQHAAELPPRSLTRTGPATPGLQVRCDRRLAQGRARPIDYVAKGLYNLKGRAGGKEDMDDDDDDEEDEEAGESSSGAARGPGWPPPALCLLTAPPASLAALLARPQPLNHGLHTTPLHPQHTAELAAAEPYRVFDGLLIEDLQEVADDIRGFKVRGGACRLDARGPAPCAAFHGWGDVFPARSVGWAVAVE